MRPSQHAPPILSVGALCLLVACNGLVGIDSQSCAPACVDETTRIFCDDRGEPQTEACPAPTNECAETACQSGQCTFKPTIRKRCGDRKVAFCNEGFACLGPDTKLSAHHHHTCLVGDDGEVWCWGANAAYELGDGTAQDRGRPALVRNLPGKAKDVSAGYAHTCALLRDGNIACWGSNDRGQCGTGSSTEPLEAPEIVPIPGMTFTALAAGRAHSCAVSSEGAVYCWGDSTYGQAGVDPSVTVGQVVGATKVEGLAGVERIETVQDHTCATSPNLPTFRCWGSNVHSEDDNFIVHKLGPRAAERRYSAEPVSLDFGLMLESLVLDIGMGAESTYASTPGGLLAWGLNTRQLLAVGSQEEIVLTPSEVLIWETAGTVPLGPVRSVLRTGAAAQCVELLDRLNHNSSFLCWGENDQGELGLGEVEAGQDVPFPLPVREIPTDSTGLVRGEDHGCAIAREDDQKTIWCYGAAHLVGNGQTRDQSGSTATHLPGAPIRWSPNPFAALPE